MVTRLMESSPSSKLSFYTESGAIIQCPVEGLACGIAIDIPKDLWPSLSLKLGTDSLPLRLEEEAKCAHSVWPALAIGDYELSLECGDIRESRRIRVVPQYFSESEFNSIIHDLTDVLPKLIASQLQECGGLSGTNLVMDHEPTLQQEFFKLRAAIRGTKERLGILQILPVIERDCYHVLIPRAELRSSKKVRRPDISKLPHAMSMPDNMYSSGALKQMFDVTMEQSFETYENQLVKAYIQALQSQISRLQSKLDSEPAAPPAMAGELEALASEFRLACTRATFLREVRHQFASAGRVTMVLLKNPAYRAVLEGYLALHKQLSVRLEEPALNAPLNKFPFLYQLWANLWVVSVMLHVCADSGYQCVSHPWIKRGNQGLFIQVMYDGEAALELSNPTTGKAVRLLPWRVDSAGENTPGSSQELPPGLAVAIYTPEKPPVVLLFDPKYKVATGTLEATSTVIEPGTKKPVPKKTSAKTKAAKNEIADALSAIEPMQKDIDEVLFCMDQIRGPGGVREIQYAAILYPGQRKQISPHLEALPARPLDGEAWQKNVYDVLSRYLA